MRRRLYRELRCAQIAVSLGLEAIRNGLYPPREVKVGETPAEETHDRDSNPS